MRQSAYAFQALKYSKKLQNVGFTPQQAEVQTEIFHEIIEDHQATKSDINDLRTDMQSMEGGIRADMKSMENGIRADMQLMEHGIRTDMNAMNVSLQEKIKNLDHNIKTIEVSLRSDIREMNLLFTKNIELLRRDMKIWLGSVMTVAVTALGTLITFVRHV